MNELLQKRVAESTLATPTGSGGPVVLTSTGDKFIISHGNPWTILRWGVVLSVAKDASALVITLANRPTAGSDTNRVVVDTMTDSATARAAGVVLERKVTGTVPNSSTGSDGSLVNVAAGGPLKFYPGQQAVFAVTTAAASTGSGYIYAEYIEHAGVDGYVYPNQPLVNQYTVVEL